MFGGLRRGRHRWIAGRLQWGPSPALGAFACRSRGIAVPGWHEPDCAHSYFDVVAHCGRPSFHAGIRRIRLGERRRGRLAGLRPDVQSVPYLCVSRSIGSFPIPTVSLSVPIVPFRIVYRPIVSCPIAGRLCVASAAISYRQCPDARGGPGLCGPRRGGRSGRNGGAGRTPRRRERTTHIGQASDATAASRQFRPCKYQQCRTQQCSDRQHQGAAQAHVISNSTLAAGRIGAPRHHLARS